MTTNDDWKELRGALGGDLVLPGDDAYDIARRVYYSQYDSGRPQAVAHCESVDDVRAALAFCRQHHLPGTPRSGGHSPGGYSTGPGLIIDVSRLDHVEMTGEITGGTVRIGPGARQVDTTRFLAPHGLALPAGICPTVRAGGFVSGGGFGWATRRFGMACDHLLSAEVVLADGRVVRTSETEEPDLFWAIRGAGSGNFGVITEFELWPQPLTHMVNYLLTWPFEAAAEVIGAWQRFTAGGPDELGAALGIPLADARPGEQPSVVANGGFLGEQAELERLLDAFVADAGHKPQTRDAETLPYADAMQRWFDTADKTPAELDWIGQSPEARIPRQAYFVDRSRLIESEIPARGIQELLDAYDADRRAGQTRFLSLFAVGGQVNRVPRTATAYVHRTSLFYLGYSVGLAADEPPGAERAAAQAWVDAGFAVADRFSAGESYQNFIDPDLTDWQQSYFAENYPRLVELKTRYDPEGFFRYAQSIG